MPQVLFIPDFYCAEVDLAAVATHGKCLPIGNPKY